jgi:predicted Zn finger-like uncharacterized protein
MFTQCPHCLTLYEPRAAQLAEGRGQLRCGVCERAFDALEFLSDEPIYARGVGVPLGAEAPRIIPEEIPEQGELFHGVATLPGFARGAARGIAAAGSGWWAAAIVLGVLLLAQIAVAQRNQLAADPGWRPWLTRLCERTGCSLQPWQSPQQIELTARDVRPHPSVDGALLITATLRNGSVFPVAWPVMELTLLDLSGDRVALRRFRPPEYLGGEPRTDAIAAGQSATATLEVADPGKGAIAFAFEFL